MDNKTAQLKKLIEIMVRKEVRAVLEEALPQMLPQMIKECMSGLIMESTVSRPAMPPQGNSAKRHALQEVSGGGEGYEEYPTMKAGPLDRNRLAEMMGYGDMVPGGGNKITVDTIITEHGTEIKLPPGAVPHELDAVFNKDYREMMKTINAKTSARHG